MSTTRTTNCLNCEKPYEEGSAFCPHCGQNVKEKLTLSVLFYNTVSNYFSFDAKILRSVIPLLFRPGYLARKFVEGKRQRYLHPGNFYFFVSVLFFLLNSSIVKETSVKWDNALRDDRDSKSSVNDSIKKEQTPEVVLDSQQVANLMKPLKTNSKLIGLSESDLKAIDSSITSNASDNKINYNTGFNFNEEQIDSLLAAGVSDTELYKHMGMKDDAGYVQRKVYEKVLKFYKKREGGTLLMKTYESIPGALFILLPIFAFLFRLFFFKRGGYSDHLVFSLYFFSFLFSIGILIILANRIVDIPDWIDWLIILSTFFYLVASAKYFYKAGWFSSLVKTGFISFMYLAIMIPVAFIFTIAYVFMFY